MPSSTTTTTAGPTSCWSTAKTGPVTATKRISTLKLYHNNHDGTFTDVTRKAGLAVSMYGMGVAVGDYDNDGFDDIFITALGQSHLFHNNGNGTFTDVTESRRLVGAERVLAPAPPGSITIATATSIWSSRNYVQWSARRPISTARSTARTNPIARRNPTKAPPRGSGTTWATANSKMPRRKPDFYDPTSKSLGIAILDYNGDGWPDILLANDTQPNKLYLNKHNGTFEEKAVSAGIAFSEDGVARAGMGVDAADYDRSGHPSLIITNFSNQMLSLYHNEGNGLFVDEAPQLGGRPRHPGHPRLRLLLLRLRSRRLARHLRRRRPHRRRHRTRAEARELRRASAPVPQSRRRKVSGSHATRWDRAFASPKVARGAAYADINNDGALDVLMTTNGGRASLVSQRRRHKSQPAHQAASEQNPIATASARWCA